VGVSTAVSTTTQTRAVVDEYFRCVNAPDWVGWVDCFTDDAVMEDALSPRIEGKEALRQSVAAMRQGFRSFSNTPLEVVCEDDRAAVVCHISAVIASGASIESTGMNFYRVTDGRVSYMASYHDPTPFIAAFSAGAAPQQRSEA
jgi:ketosteroid isomerase-like protein